jgi:hypothetical protein
MSTAMELIVGGFTRLKDRQALEDLKAHRQQLALNLRAVTGCDCQSSIAQIDQEIAIIKAGLDTLSCGIAG